MGSNGTKRVTDGITECGHSPYYASRLCQKCYVKVQGKRWIEANPSRRRGIGLEHYYRKQYGLTLKEAHMLRQQPCAICNKKTARQVIDHKHGTLGTYRGVLCYRCNSFLGWFENFENSIRGYLNGNQ